MVHLKGLCIYVCPYLKKHIGHHLQKIVALPLLLSHDDDITIKVMGEKCDLMLLNCQFF